MPSDEDRDEARVASVPLSAADILDMQIRLGIHLIAERSLMELCRSLSANVRISDRPRREVPRDR